jgi:hypothetical protein
MSKSRVIVACTLFILAFSASAQTTPAPAAAPGGDQFATRKQNELNRIAARLQVMQALQTCVQAATDHKAMRACNQTARQSAKGQGK